MANNYANNIYNLNCDSFEIEEYNLGTNGLKIWIPVGIANKTLEYPDRREIITEECLFNLDSINTLIGSAITLNHPPEAVQVGVNKRRLQVGTILEQYVKDGDRLFMSGIIDDKPTMDAVLNGEVKFASSGYYAHKENINGIWHQKFRDYNHVAALTLDSMPRAGLGCEIISFNPATPNKPKNQNQDSIISPEQISRMVGERVKLWTEWKDVLSENDLAINYNLDTSDIKRQILRTYYDDTVVNNIDNTNIDGFWLSFEAQNKSITQNNDSQQSYKTPGIDYRQELIKQLEGVS